jgi:hypothetical protein
MMDRLGLPPRAKAQASHLGNGGKVAPADIARGQPRLTATTQQHNTTVIFNSSSKAGNLHRGCCVSALTDKLSVLIRLIYVISSFFHSHSTRFRFNTKNIIFIFCCFIRTDFFSYLSGLSFSNLNTLPCLRPCSGVLVVVGPRQSSSAGRPGPAVPSPCTVV